MGKDKLRLQIQTEKRIYDDSPQVTVIYKDLSRIMDYMLEIVEDRKINGFKEEN